MHTTRYQGAEDIKETVRRQLARRLLLRLILDWQEEKPYTPHPGKLVCP